MIRFHEVLDAAVLAIRAAATPELEKHSVTLIRDLAGRIQLFIDKPVAQDIVGRLRSALGERLGPYTQGTIWARNEQRDSCHTALAGLVRSERREFEPTGGRHPTDPHWFLIERHVSKSSWTQEAGSPPWPLDPNAPAIVSFYSFKGGVGRSTALAVVSAMLARQGYRVTVVDLDLEAPGVETVLLPGLEPFEGVLDYLLEKPVHGSAYRAKPLIHLSGDQAIVGDGEAISVLGAGAIDASYLEKLARLDVERMVREEAPAVPMIQLFKELRSATKPDLILIDCRAGFHDLGGLAVAHLSHLALVFGTYSPQTRRGLQELVRILGASTERAALDVRIVQTMVPEAPREARERVVDHFRNDSYEIFCEHFYDEADVPDIGDTEAQHFPLATIPEMAPLRIERPWDHWERIEPAYGPIVRALVQRTGRPPLGKAKP